MKFFCGYLKDRRKGILTAFVFSAVFAAVFAMYHLPLKAVAYPLMICIVIGAVCLILDYAAARKKHLMLAEMKNLTAEMINGFGNASSMTDVDYQNIIKSLKAQMSELEARSELRYRDMIDYYTMWAHQIKTPIASMRLTLQGEDTPLSGKLLGDLFRIEQYVEMVMAYLRLDSDHSDYVFREHDIDMIIKQSVKKFSHEFIGKRISLEYEPIKKKIITDDKWLSFVLEQVLSNSLKYTRSGSIKIFLESEDVLCIEDSGIGIAAEDLPRIFQKGYTGCNGRNDKKASGIGLYLCMKVCKNLGLDMRAESEIGKGTAMKISLKQYKVKE